MKAFEDFVVSDAFFPILILLLVMLIGVFIRIIISNKKEEKLKREKKQNLVIDETSQIKIIDSNNKEVSLKKYIEEDDEEEISDEVTIFEEIAIKKKEQKIPNIIEKKEPFDYQKEAEDEIIQEKVETENNPYIDAFSSQPNEEKEINEDIIVDEQTDYYGEKTEVFDFPDFNEEEILNNDNVEDSIIEAANEYIESIMQNK